MTLDPGVFKAYDVRGLYPSEIDEDGARDLGRGFVEVVRAATPGVEAPRIAIGHDGKYLYYSRSAIDFTIWRIPVTGGPEEQVPGVPKPFDTSHWAVVASGIYLVNGNGDLVFFQFGRNTVTTVFHEQRFLTDWSMAISPDGREIAWAQIDDSAADLMLVENFR